MSNNIWKLNTSIRQIRKVAKSLKTDTNNLEIEAKKEDCITINIEGIIFFL